MSFSGSFLLDSDGGLGVSMGQQAVVGSLSCVTGCERPSLSGI